MDIQTQTELLEKIRSEYLTIVKNYYPDIASEGSGYAGPRFHYTISRFCRHYRNTPFYYNKELKFVHWTSLSNLSSIINNAEIRLYNLQNSEDNDEFSYAGKILELPDKAITAIKNNYFTASFCSIEDLHNKYLWRKYGKGYKGVAIVFSLLDNRDTWEDFFLSPVYYELDPKFKDFQIEIGNLQNKYAGTSFLTDIWRFAGFYKKNNFRKENEIRLSGIYPLRSETESMRFVRKEIKIEKGRNRIVSYIPLKLWMDPDSSYFKTLDLGQVSYGTFEYNKTNLPQLKIEQIHFGTKCGLSDEEYWNFTNQLKEIFEWRLGYSIDLPLNLFQEI